MTFVWARGVNAFSVADMLSRVVASANLSPSSLWVCRPDNSVLESSLLTLRTCPCHDDVCLSSGEESSCYYDCDYYDYIDFLLAVVSTLNFLP